LEGSCRDLIEERSTTCLEETDENHEKPQSEYTVFRRHLSIVFLLNNEEPSHICVENGFE
jgi:hypothetical protein